MRSRDNKPRKMRSRDRQYHEKISTPAHDADIYLNGSTLEGGGQLVRIALALSALTHQSLVIDHIRGKRSDGGGLKAQHLASIEWLGRACGARVVGAAKRSPRLDFIPAPLLSPTATSAPRVPPVFTKQTLPPSAPSESPQQVYTTRLDIGTAGATTLVLQAVLPYILFTPLPSALPIHVHVSGGTNVSGAPSYDYLVQVLLPTLARIGFPGISATLGRRGWARGGIGAGEFTLVVPKQEPLPRRGFVYGPRGEESRARKIRDPSGVRATFLGPVEVHEHLRKVLPSMVEFHFGSDATRAKAVELVIDCESTSSEQRLYLLLTATFPSGGPSSDETGDEGYVLGRDWLYERKIVHKSTIERAVTEMAGKVTADLSEEWMSGTWVDEHMRDQLLVFQALSQGTSEVFGGFIIDDDGHDDVDDEAGDEDDGGEDDDPFEDDENEYEGGEGNGDQGEHEAEGHRNLASSLERLREPSLHTRTAEWVAKQMLGVTFSEAGRCEGVGFVGRGETSDAKVVDDTAAAVSGLAKLQVIDESRRS